MRLIDADALKEKAWNRRAEAQRVILVNAERSEE